jgi:hypothetical protein
MLGWGPEIKSRWGLLYLITKAFYELKVSQISGKECAGRESLCKKGRGWNETLNLSLSSEQGIESRIRVCTVAVLRQYVTCNFDAIDKSQRYLLDGSY